VKFSACTAADAPAIFLSVCFTVYVAQNALLHEADDRFQSSTALMVCNGGGYGGDMFTVLLPLP
jgi:hypothetical protein